MKVLILHSEIDPCAAADEQDVLVQVETVTRALRALGHEAQPMPFSLDLAGLADRMTRSACDIVFNLVETAGGQGRLIHLAPSLLDFLGIPYTGAGTEATFLSSNKLAAKRFLRARRLRTPDWVSLTESTVRDPFPAGARFIVKSVWEHASVGLEEHSVVAPRSLAALRGEIRGRLGSLGGAAFAERYVEGREFNLSVLAGDRGPEVLPPAEIDFVGYGDERLRIVGYRAKWDDKAFEYHHTPRRFEFGPQDRALLRSLKRTALRCWDLFGLRGYARVDYRVDPDGTAWILEINSNPCLSPDSGFTAATLRAGLPFEEVVSRIIRDTLGTA
ncbi:MAG: D-alanine--D-alanine ligase [Syntrophaceae bacterium]|nr:D-alanine--D-alanine ligase [Syntrophaceae bacterium]